MQTLPTLTPAEPSSCVNIFTFVLVKQVNGVPESKSSFHSASRRLKCRCTACPSTCTARAHSTQPAPHTSAYVSVHQRTSAYVSICQHMSAYVRRVAHAPGVSNGKPTWQCFFWDMCWRRYRRRKRRLSSRSSKLGTTLVVAVVN